MQSKAVLLSMLVFTAYSIWVQILGEELAAHMFLQREVRDNA